MTHILVFPYPAQGHMLPLLDLTHYLSLHGLTITILVTPKNLQILHPFLSQNPSVQTLVLPFPSHPSIPPGVENVKDIGNSGNSHIISALTQLSIPITVWFHSHPSPPQVIISNFFLGWTQELASQLGIPHISFYGVGALFVSVFNHLWLNFHTQQPPPESFPFPHLPNSPVLPLAHIPTMFRKITQTNPVFQTIKASMTANMSSWGIIINSFDAIESPYLDYIRKEVGHRRVWSVGPVALLDSSDKERGGRTSISPTDVLSWLDHYTDGAVVYVCFGSQVFLRREQMESLAKGLEESKVPFILVVKSETWLPDGFENRVVERGLIIKGWAPQVSILSHKAVGGFLTHCGWNSVLEGIVAGVMLFAWPMEADHFVNAKLFVDYLGVAVRVFEGVDTVPDAAELARFLSESMTGMGFEKVRAMELQAKALGAVKEDGSSKKDLDDLVQQLLALSLPKEEGI